ncbi:MAG: hypothetical protein JSR82_03310 [Verrucomicrobia bacterium]|nr:hypothetical protein [Verrucomicrobiota bacterium]
MPTAIVARHPIRSARKDPTIWQVRAVGRVRLGPSKANARVEVFLQAGRVEKMQEFPVGLLALLTVNSLWQRGARTHRAANFGPAKRYQVIVTGPGELVRPSEHRSYFGEHYFLPRDAYFSTVLVRAKAVVKATGEPGLEQDRSCVILIPTTTVVVDLLGQTGALVSALINPAPDWESSFWVRGSPSRPRTFVGPEQGAVTVCLPGTMGEDEAMTSAYLFLDDFAREEARKIHRYHDREDPDVRHIVMRLPFQGERQMEVVGIFALTTPKAKCPDKDPPPPDPYWALLTHQITYCDLRLPALETVHFEKVDDGSPSAEKAEGELKPRSGPPLIAPTNPEGKDLDTDATGRSGQKARGWDVIGHHPHFGRVTLKRLPKQAPKSEARPGDIPETGEFESVAVGPTSGRGTVPPLRLQAAEENETWRDSLQALGEQPEYAFAVGVVLRLGACGWTYAPLVKSDWIFQQQVHEQSRGGPKKVFAAYLQHESGIAGLLFEYPHRDSQSGVRRSQSGTLLARIAGENPGEVALAEFVANERCAFRIAQMAAPGWALRALKHCWAGTSDEVAISRHATKISKSLRSSTFIEDSIWQALG